ncbi:Cupin 2 conserved barrel domain protein [Candidatus Sodalis pierantonius str. SOPE]|uniref:Cupin 2 conserved barrel domain protein n=1 Tax=Candidatus Sodalis pierantonii str. SOPE TaxID=2342 RepID=W0HK20_9GAMM|nr:cupin domain-containing protein [Candidatus Sodalis pierantonius]AHF74211.1 Cupin 2 conserved barrel domain protein [Candidatus Sodalis pierantonius str. SOPE]
MGTSSLQAATALLLHDLITPTEQGIASRVLAKTQGGNVTLFAFDRGQALSEHSAPFDALALVVAGRIGFTVGGEPLEAQPEMLVRLPANVPHALQALEASRMLLIMLREPAVQG